MKIKLLGSLVAALGLISTAEAATTYSIHGTQGYTIDVVTYPLAQGGMGGILTQNPSPPSFSGSWDIDLTTGQLSNGFNFEPYSVSVDLTASAFGVIDLFIPDRSVSLVSGTYNYNSATRTISIINGIFEETSPGIECGGSGSILCSSLPGPATPMHGDLTLTFAADLLSFTGVANIYQLIPGFPPTDGTGICLGEGGANFCANNALAFSGVATVPVPAAAWLFGSAVLGLAGLKRRKAA